MENPDSTPDLLSTRNLEYWFPWGLSIIFSIIFWFTQKPLPPEVFTKILDKVIDVCAIAIGFLGTAQSILLSLSGRKILANLKALGRFGDLVSFLSTAIYLAFCTAGISTIFLYLAPVEGSVVPPWATSTLFFFCILSVFLWLRIIRLYSRILKTG